MLLGACLPTLVVRVSAKAKKLALSPRSFRSVSLHWRNCTVHHRSCQAMQGRTLAVWHVRPYDGS